MKSFFTRAAVCLFLVTGSASVRAENLHMARPAAPRSPVTLGVSSHWQGHRAYLSDFTNTVVREWNKAKAASDLKVPPGSVVTVEIVLASDGNVGRIVSLRGDVGAEVKALCQNALMAGHSYGRWTEAMIKDLGSSQEMEVTFHF